MKSRHQHAKWDAAIKQGEAAYTSVCFHAENMVIDITLTESLLITERCWLWVDHGAPVITYRDPCALYHCEWSSNAPINRGDTKHTYHVCVLQSEFYVWMTSLPCNIIELMQNAKSALMRGMKCCRRSCMHWCQAEDARRNVTVIENLTVLRYYASSFMTALRQMHGIVVCELQVR